MIASLIIILDNSISPAHIARFIVAVIIDAVKTAAVRAWAETGKEAFKCTKFSGDTNAAASVLRKLFAVWIFTARHHRTPRPMRSCLQPYAFIAMSEIQFRGEFTLPAPTGFRIPTQQAVGHNNGLVSAIAAAKNASLSMTTRRCFANNDQSEKAASSQIMRTHNVQLITMGWY